MSPFSITFGFVFIAGIVGLISLANSFRFLPAHETIDHPSNGLRIFYRLMAIFMCQLFSFFLTTAFFGALPIPLRPLDASDSELTKAIVLLLLAPLPLTAILYLLYAKLVRWASRQENAR